MTKTEEKILLRLTKSEKSFVTLQANKDKRSINSTIRVAIQSMKDSTK
jgi:predicted HicB family RNase H-like nuclease